MNGQSGYFPSIKIPGKNNKIFLPFRSSMTIKLRSKQLTNQLVKITNHQTNLRTKQSTIQETTKRIKENQPNNHITNNNGGVSIKGN